MKHKHQRMVLVFACPAMIAVMVYGVGDLVPRIRNFDQALAQVADRKRGQQRAAFDSRACMRNRIGQLGDVLAEILEQLNVMVELIGPWPSVAIVVVVFGLPALFSYLRDGKVERAYTKLVDSKEEQIQRLADSEKRYRDFFLQQQGLDPEELKLLDKRAGPRRALRATRER